ncbi:hypothetical protein LCGC14_1025270 [marine sediment metagenome]|uniref:DNA (cytosine-5-)-methyltransferase n=1 Tax=marine sediment metagenome TaxID=412755 RepID=A0A0F9NHX4_9ZZZZ
MKFGSLFSGIGGMDKGLEDAGMECAWQVEIDDYCQKVLTKHWPDVPKFKDVRDVGRKNLKPVDLICGGFPCQDVSVAGRRAGLGGERSSLWWEFARIIEELRPRWVVIENVPGLLSSWTPTEPPPFSISPRTFDKKEEAEEWGNSLSGEWDVEETNDLETILVELEKLGYFGAFRIFDAQYFNLAQRRARVFIVGHLTEPTYPIKVLFEPESGERHSPPGREKGKVTPPRTATGVGAGRTENERNELDFVIPFSHSRGHGKETDIAPTLNSRTKDGMMKNQEGLGVVEIGQGYWEEGKPKLDKSFAGKPRNLIAFHNRQDPDVSGEVTHPLGTKDNGMGVAYGLNSRGNRYDGESQSLITETAAPLTVKRGGGSNQRPAHNEADNLIAWHENKEGNLSSDNETARALRSSASHSYQGIGVRRLTPLECERLQGFPDDWTLGQSDTQRYKMLGNAVALPVAKAIGEMIVRVDS